MNGLDGSNLLLGRLCSTIPRLAQVRDRPAGCMERYRAWHVLLHCGVETMSQLPNALEDRTARLAGSLAALHGTQDIGLQPVHLRVWM